MYLLALAILGLVKSEPVELKTDTGTLFATLDVPPGTGPFPAVVLHPGSGPTDRDGNQPALKNDSLKMLGRGLALHGVVVLRIDKRGIAASRQAGPKEEDLSVGLYAADAAAWAKWLRADKRVTKVGFVGHSEGSLIGTLAGQREKLDAFVSLCGPGRKFGDLLREQLKPKLSKELFAASDAVLTKLEAGETVADFPAELKALFRPSVQPYLISELALDPAAELGKLTCPVLVASGSTDIQVTADDAKLLAAARKGVRVLRVEGMNHVLKPVADPKDQLRTYLDPSLPIDPRLVSGLARFLRAALR